MQTKKTKIPKRQLQKKLEDLKSICNEINPYDPIPEDLKKKLERFDISEFHDPFFITNKLLLLLENTIEEIEYR